MAYDGNRYVIDEEGERRPIVSREQEEDEQVGHVVVRLTDGRPLCIIESLLEPRDDGDLYVPLRFRQMEEQESDVLMVLPVVEESLRVRRQTRETGRVRIHREIDERQEVVDEPVFEDRVEVERVTVDRRVDEPVEPHYEGDTYVIPVLREVLVVSKQLVLAEEIRIRKHREEARHPQEYTLRSERVTVERTSDEVTGRTKGGDA